MHKKTLMRFVVELLLLLSLVGGVAVVPAPAQAHTAGVQTASVHRNPLCPGAPPCI